MLDIVTKALNDLADAATRLTSVRGLTVNIEGTAQTDRTRADNILRNLKPQEIAALKKKLGL